MQILCKGLFAEIQANYCCYVELGKNKAMSLHEARSSYSHFSTANASPSFEGKGGDDVALELSNGLAEILNEKTLDLESLCIVPGKHCWSLFVDAVVSRLNISNST